ncbi:tungstate ABC transporter permease WtpB [Archaeoglobus profundus]|uniref:Molybdate/tungstate transport system permease protein WtpB n=1 Tax=Archaeoglobus profundus (strain DSM 5631 / JCM 9629 / NBRC 100127 / Av18) TaxID=572546 RepID=D2RFG3_ARCPA|nr:tungstate ABC transporter permease WtpB [Archaeoglobus profundus]ADB58857.1 binding-protein-dependent transport systems inner membrane component [Archaeoglobus profundus DSM 5631]
MNRRDYIDIFFIILGSFLLFYIILPIFTLLLRQCLDIGTLIKVLRDEVVLNALKNTFLTAGITTLIALVLGVPLGYVLARKEFRYKSLIQGIVDVPIVIPHSVVGIMLLTTFSDAILDSYLGIIMAMLFVSASFTINSARDGFLAVDKKLEDVARTLGAGKFKTFLTVSLPLAFASILSGAIMTFARAVSEVGAILVVAYYPKTAQILVLEYFENFGLKYSTPISVILIVLSLTIFAILRWLLKRSDRHAKA